MKVFIEKTLSNSALGGLVLMMANEGYTILPDCIESYARVGLYIIAFYLIYKQKGKNGNI